MYHSNEKKKQGPYKAITISGTVCHIEERNTMSGHFILTARVRTDEGKMFPCVLFNDQARDFSERDFQDQRVHIEGRLKEDGEIGVKFFDGEGSKSKPQRGSVQSITAQDRERYAIYLEANGFALVDHRVSDACTVRGSARKQDCIKVNGKWEMKIEYVMRVLGGKEVTEQLRGFGDNGEPKRVTRVNPKEYKEKLSELINFCAARNGDYIEGVGV